ncbi:hypothetical protein ACP275_02G084600 [Erythranthe tilingii]
MAFSSSSSSFGQKINSSSNSSNPFRTLIEGSSVFAQNISSPFQRSNSSGFGGFQATTISQGSAYTPSFGDLLRGSTVPSYSPTLGIDENGSKFQSISAMPIYQSKSHEELRLEDYELKQESNSYAGRFDMAATTSKSYVSPPFGSPCTQFASISGSNNGLFGASMPTIFGARNTSGISFNSKPTAVGSESANGSNINSIFGVSNAFAPLSASTGFTFPTTLQFGIKPTPPLWSTSASVVPSTSSSSTPTTVGFGVQSSSGGQTKPIFPFPPLSNPFIFQAATTPPLCSTSTSVVPNTSASESTSAFGVQRPADCFKASPFDNIFHVPPLSNQCTSNSPFHPKPCFDTPASTLFQQPGQTTNSLSQPSQASNGSTIFTEQTINGQEQSANPFGIQYEIDGPNAVITIRHGTSIIQVSGEISSLAIREVSSRHDNLPARGNSGGSIEPKVPFVNNEEDRPFSVDPLHRPCFINSREFQGTTITWGYCMLFLVSYFIHYLIWFSPQFISMSFILSEYIFLAEGFMVFKSGKGCEGKACPKASFRMNVNETELSDDTSVKDEDEDEVLIKHEADVLELMPKLPDSDYYTEPSLKDLAAKEISEPGFCSRVNDFVVGRKGYGSIKFLGETDIRNLDIESVIHFNNREVIVYPDSTKKPPAGQSLNKPAEVTLMNVKCISKKTGKEYVDGVEVENYKEMLIKKTSKHGAEFVSFDPVLGEWKFRVQHF